MTPEQVEPLIRQVFGAFPGVTVGPGTLALWRDELRALQVLPEIATQAVRRLVFDGQRSGHGRPPTLPEVVAAIRRQHDATQPRQKERRDPTREEAISICREWSETARQVIGTKGWSTLIPHGWTAREYSELAQRRTEARIPHGRERWGQPGFPGGNNADACHAAFAEWARKLPWTEEQKRMDRQIVDAIEAERRNRADRLCSLQTEPAV